jgi:hypothetical protein
VIGNVCTEKSPFVTHEVLELSVQRNLSNGLALKHKDLKYATKESKFFLFSYLEAIPSP